MRIPLRSAAAFAVLLHAVPVPALQAQEAGGVTPCVGGEAPSAVPEVRRIYMDAFNEGRIDDVLAIHTADVVSMPSGLPPLVGRAALRDVMDQSARTAPPGFRFEFEARELRTADGWAVERGVTRAHLGDGGEVPGGKYVLLYERGEDGCWRIAWSITNNDRP